MSMKVAFYTLGCKLNQAETESLAGRLSRPDFRSFPPAMEQIFILPILAPLPILPTANHATGSGWQDAEIHMP